ncbi:hypothetical protein PAECIP111802_04892 [Paenibacillus allorhizosphaerae]|uniref:Uncharacterized protein n=1 Tax=Paenibacillus allorhizosphaerae TaxID=2849866 RepID=A0ABM8VNB9_9BACL|nr:hypothetical protein PAECIP111802_04892 [Paenibacillus allorhizosphaerae]
MGGTLLFMFQSELIHRYIIIKRRKDPNEYFAIYKDIHELDDIEAGNEINRNEELFVKELASVL